MIVTFRADASVQIGTGHLTRCITLAEALSRCDECVRITFVSRHILPHLQELIASKGYDLILLNNKCESEPIDELPHSEWLGTSQYKDAHDTVSAISNLKSDWLVVDHYALDFRWESMLRSSAKKIMVIDDLADRNHDCDVLLDQNLYHDQETRYKNRISSQCKMLIGPRYSLLRNEFAEFRNKVKPRENKIERILVFFGGVDACDYTTKTIIALSKIASCHFFVDVVIGSQHPNKKEIESLCIHFGYSCHVQTSKVAELMANADFAIGAGGGAMWERACLMLPTLTIPIAKHQIKQIVDVALIGATCLFDVETYTSDKIKVHIELLIENSSLRKFLSTKSSELVDGIGAQRVTQELRSEININLRQANLLDEKFLFESRSHPKIRQVSFNKSEFSWEQHQNWFRALLLSSNRVLLIGEYKNKPAGVVRFDLENDSAEISIYLVQDSEFSGLGLPLIKNAEKWIFLNRSEIKTLTAKVIEGNSVSKSFFLKAGYIPKTTVYFKEL